MGGPLPRPLPWLRHWARRSEVTEVDAELEEDQTEFQGKNS